MFDDWSIWGSIIALGVIMLFVHSGQKSQCTFSKKIKYVHVRAIRKF